MLGTFPPRGRDTGFSLFASGGVVGGPLGSPHLAVVHGGETVVPAGQGAGDVLVELHMSDKAAELVELIDTRVIHNAPAISKRLGTMADHRRRSGRF